MTFVHLHVHSEYSFLDGACRLTNLVRRAKELRMPALALTDHGGLHGAVEFYQLARENGIKPIIGCEVYLTPNYHLILLAKNHKGYENLVQLVSRSYLEGYYYKPRIDWELLCVYAGGLVALSGCLSGEIPQLLLMGNYRQAKLKALEYRKLFGPDFYLELQNHGLKEDARSNLLLRKLALETGIPLVATNDVHYIHSRENTVQELMAAIRNRQRPDSNPIPFAEPSAFVNPIPFPKRELYLKSPSEMNDLFGEIPEALENTLKISEKCNLELDLGVVRLPDFPLDQWISHDDFLFHLCREGLTALYQPVTPQIEERLAKELETIRKMRLAPYFLVVADLVAFARGKGIPVGPGRGSAGGSLAAYCLGITHVDPIKHNLFFERFLNPQRPDLPDIDLDFCQERRHEVLSYLTEKYGAGNVAQIGIFSTLGARGAIRDAGKALGIPEQSVDLVAKNLPRFSGHGGIEHALNTLPEFRELPWHEEPFRTLIEKAKSIEGRIRHTSVHAAGVVIGQGELSKIVPLQPAPGGETVTQYGPESLEALGLIKIDLLGLRNLTIIDHTLKSLMDARGIKLTPDTIPLDDPATYHLLRKGETLGCFQLESSGIRSLIKKLKPTRLEDLIAVLALYRPGPLDSGLVESYLKRRQGEETTTYLHPLLKPVLKDSYGIILFQEQVMQIANAAAGYDLGEADLLRRKIAKKGTDFAAEQAKFVQACLKNGLSKKVAFKIFESLTKFAGYSFNKAHSTAYAYLSYQTVFLKANYPVEYFSALLSSMTGYYSLSVYMEEARRRGISFLPPDINKSSASFTVEAGSIRVGLALIKGIGIRAIQEILEARKHGSGFASFYDFCSRINLKIVNRTALNNVINCGAFDSTGLSRPQLSGNLEKILKFLRKKQKANKGGQLSFADLGLMPEDSGLEYNLNIPDYSEEEKNYLERQLLSVSLREHPFARYKDLFRQGKIFKTDALARIREGARVSVAGIVVSSRRQPTKNKEYMLFMLLEDPYGQIEIILYPSVYQKYLYELQPEGIIVTGRLFFEGEQPKVKAESIQALSEKLHTNSVRQA